MLSSTCFYIDYLQAGPKNKQCAKILIQNSRLVRICLFFFYFVSLSTFVIRYR